MTGGTLVKVCTFTAKCDCCACPNFPASARPCAHIMAYCSQLSTAYKIMVQTWHCEGPGYFAAYCKSHDETTATTNEGHAPVHGCHRAAHSQLQ
jgi:hypothetical protein